MITELDYINMLPDLSKFHDVYESSFLKGIGNTSILVGQSGQPDTQQQERIKSLEHQLEQHRKQIEELEEERKSHSASTPNSECGSETGVKDDQVEDLKKQLK